MQLRKHQKALVDICGEILQNRKINLIIASVTPGGGKSAMPVIIADNLIPAIADRICWVVPRNNLKIQGEAEFIEPRWHTKHRIIAAANGPDMPQGLSGYVTTYQAIAENPKVHFDEFSRHRYILFMDEPHHISVGSSWENALEPLVKMSTLCVDASGTFSRHDGKKIAFLKYDGEYVDLKENETTRVINYTRKDALAEGAIVKIIPDLIDGHAEWKDSELDTAVQSAKISSYEDGHKALYAALRTEYAYQLLSKGTMLFSNFINTEKADAKLLVVAPNIEYAKRYNEWLISKGHLSRIATSEESDVALRNINDYKRGAFNVLVTVAMAYEGLSVPEISHLVLLTFIRSVPWIDQCLARLNRVSKGKQFGLVIGPKDPKLLKAIKMINNDQMVPIQMQPEMFEPVAKKEGNGIVTPWIHPHASVAEGIDQLSELSIAPFIQPSQQEKNLKTEINKIRTMVVNGKKPGASMVAKKIINKKIRNTIGKTISEASIPELEKVWMKLRKDYLTK